MAKNKLFKRVAPTQSNSELISNIDEMLKTNKGGFSAQGFDTDSTFTPHKVSDVKVSNPYGVNQTYKAPQVNQAETIEPYIPQRPKFDMPEQSQANENRNDSLARQFIQYFNQTVTPSNQQSSYQDKQQFEQETGLPFAVDYLKDGGVLHSDGIVRYTDGTVRQFTNDRAIPIQTKTDGSILYSDGSIRQIATTGQFLTQENISYKDSGFNGLIYGIFGDNSPQITQTYGNYNRGMGYANNIHRGTDFSGRNQDNLSLPTEAQVVEVTSWDGQSTSGQQAYGNSILLRLKTGEMLRFSHLKEAPNFVSGEIIPAMQSFGQIGSTGNSTGNHLDLEYYDAQGNIADPSNFSGFGANAQQFRQEAIESLKTTYQREQQNMSVMQPQQRQEIEKQNQALQEPRFEAPQTDIIQPQYQNTQLSERVSKPQAVGRVLGQEIENLNPTGNFDLGVSEILSGRPKLAAEKIEATNPTGQFDLGITERLKGNKQQGQEALSGTFERSTQNLPTRNRFDLGISEAMRGDLEGSQQVRQATTENIERKIQEGLGNAQTFITDFLSSLKLDSLPKVGEGLVKQAYAANEPTRPNMSEINSEYNLKVGDSPSQPQLNMGKGYQGQVLGADTVKDIRDPFFKSGASKQFADYLPENADEIYGGALDVNLFDKSFFERRNAGSDIQKVFGGTYMQPEGEKRFSNYRTQENQRVINDWRSKYSDPLRYNQDEVNRMFQQVSRPSNDFLDISKLPQPQYKEPSLDDYLRAGKSIAEYYAETGKQGELDRLGGPEKAQQMYNEQKAAEAKKFEQPSSNVPISSNQNLQSFKSEYDKANQNPNPDSLYIAGSDVGQSNISKLGQSQGMISLPGAGPEDLIAKTNKQSSIFDGLKNLFARIF